MRHILDGTWVVVRGRGLLPPCGVRKRIAGGRGVTTLLGVPVGRFAVRNTTLVYAMLPVRDELVPVDDDVWHGTGFLLKVPFCQFRLVRAGARSEPLDPGHRRRAAR